MAMTSASYRPRYPGHDYYGRGVYLVTLVISGRVPLLGRLGNYAVHLSPLGEKVQQEWVAIPTRQMIHGNKSQSEAILKPGTRFKATSAHFDGTYATPRMGSGRMPRVVVEVEVMP